MREVPLGTTGKAEKLVTPDTLASSSGSGEVPVFSTPSLVLLMEEAAVQAIRGYLEPGETTVGSSIDIKHLASTPPGLVVTATAVLDQIDGRRLHFRVEARDGIDLVGKGTHERFLVSKDRFISRANEKSTRRNTSSVE